MVACSTNRLLYVSDLTEGCVWQVTAGGKVDYRLPTWSPTRRKATAVFPVSLSVRRGRLVVVEVGNVTIYDPHDNKADEIRFPDSVTLHHALENDRHSVMVALTDNSMDIGSSAIREMRPDGSGKWFPVREWSLKSPDISRRLYMAWDTLGFLHVVICNSRRILVLDDTLTEMRSVRLSRRSMASRLCFLARRQKLFLVVDSSAGVSVYDGVVLALKQPKVRRNITL